MMNRRTMEWSSAMRDLRHEPSSCVAVREEPLRAAEGLRPGSLPLSAWRGRSGRRYIVAIHPLTEASLLDADGAVVLAVGREEGGAARVVSTTSAEPEMGSVPRARFLHDAGARGATELHVHRLADGRLERRAAVADLTETEDVLA
jgi:hypothetical protein